MKKQISIFGKSTVKESKKSYQIIKEVAQRLVLEGCICMHGGYSGGVMQAVADGAQLAIQENHLDPGLNIGVPEQRFDKKWPRVPFATFTEPASDIYDRLRTLMTSDVFIVAPDGGEGTFLELDIAIHENSINQLLGKPTKPIICLEGEDKKWTNLFISRLRYLDISKREEGQYPWISFIDCSGYGVSELVDIIVNKINHIDWSM